MWTFPFYFSPSPASQLIILSPKGSPMYFKISLYLQG